MKLFGWKSRNPPAPTGEEPPPQELMAICDGYWFRRLTTGDPNSTADPPEGADPPSVEVLVHSEPGGRHENEDAVAFEAHPRDPRIILCSLADGQGGRAGGAAAARLAVRSSLETAAGMSPRELARPAAWSTIIQRIDAPVTAEPEAGFTTLISVGFVRGTVVGASCGDSTALLIQEGAGRWLTERQRSHPVIGSGAADPAPFHATVPAAGKVLLMSDGVWKYVGLDRGVELAQEGDAPTVIHRPREAALERGLGKLLDDFSIAILEQRVTE